MITAFIKTSFLKDRFEFEECNILDYIRIIQRERISERASIEIFPLLANPIAALFFHPDGLADSEIESDTNHLRITLMFGNEIIEITLYGSETSIIKIHFNLLVFKAQCPNQNAPGIILFS